jgi:hypothetical protein
MIQTPLTRLMIYPIPYSNQHKIIKPANSNVGHGTGIAITAAE